MMTWSPDTDLTTDPNGISRRSDKQAGGGIVRKSDSKQDVQSLRRSVSADELPLIGPFEFGHEEQAELRRLLKARFEEVESQALPPGLQELAERLDAQLERKDTSSSD